MKGEWTNIAKISYMTELNYS